MHGLYGALIVGRTPPRSARSRSATRSVVPSTRSAPEAPAADAFAGASGEQAWLEVIKKMDEVYHELLDYEAALEQKNAALEESQQFILSVLTSMSDVLIACSRSGAIEDVNRSLLKLTGKSAAELRGTPVVDLFADEASRRIVQDQLRAASGMPLTDCEVQLCTPGQAVPVTISCTPRVGATGRRLGMVLTGRPVGELRRAYSALSAAHDELKRTQQQLLHSEKMASLGRLVAGVAHELNNPISFVLGNVAVLKKYADRIARYLACVHGASDARTLATLRTELGIDRLMADLPSLIDGTIEGAERTRDVVDGLKRFSAPGADQALSFDLVPVIDRAVQWVCSAAPDRFEVAIDAPDALPVRGNPGQLQQVVMNLVQNAADATASAPAARLAIGARVERGRVVVTFRDNGPGIAPENLARVFDPFFTTKPVGKGTGLGLSISYGIIERHGGTLTAESPAGGGAQFTLVVPAGPSPGS